jgi:hypothetical protein
MTWVAHDPHPNAKDSRPFYTYICKDAKGEDYYAAYIVPTDQGFKATVPNPVVPPRGQLQVQQYHYTHDTLQDAKDWCIAELWKRRLDQ